MVIEACTGKDRFLYKTSTLQDPHESILTNKKRFNKINY